MSHHIDLSALPAPRFGPGLSQAQIRAQLVAEVESRWRGFSKTAESDPVRVVIDACAYLLWVWQGRHEDSARQTLLAFAEGANLDQVAALSDTGRLAGESDDGLRHRAQLAPLALSVAGPEAAYEAAARAVEGIVSAHVRRPNAGEIEVSVLGSGDARAPSAAELAAVTAALRDENVRPATDDVTVVAGAEIPFDVTAEISILPGPATAAVLAAAEAGVRAYATEQSELGTAVTRSGLARISHSRA